MFFLIELGNDHEAHVDRADFDALADFEWRWRPMRNSKEVQAARYVAADGKRRLSYLQDEIMQPAKGLVVAFLNGNRLDCRRDNLLVVTKEEARRYRRKPKRQYRPRGVKYLQREKRWMAEIKLDGVWRRLGKYRCQAEAVLAQIRAKEEDQARQRPGVHAAARSGG